MLLKDTFQVMSGHSPGLPPFDRSVFEQNERGYTLYLVGFGHLRIAVHIDLQDPHFVSEFGRNLLDHRSHHFARSTPGRMKVNQYRFFSLNNVIEFFVCHGAKIRSTPAAAL